ncbi:restriction endonuclease subunit S [Megasphaera sp.]|uniref:restriction endonuclease subunit S n=1 Tax=Megasphaera sp. TaxID=2023260 RepID=UPI00257D7801|nr:restriction endonuclease subunit S [Megasphaera sp.]
MGKYSEYKTINLPWLAKIPANWELIRNKQFLREKKDIVGDLSNQFTLLSLTLRGVIKRDLSEKKGKLPGSFDTYKIISPGDIIFCLFDMDETPRTVGLSEYDGMLTGAYTVFQVNGINPQFLYYYYLSLDNIKALRPLYTGLRKTIKTDTFLALKLPVPPRAEQDQIVRFLDWKVSEINKLIGIRRKEIQELEELKAEIINSAILQGIDSNVVMKKTDVYYLPKIPATWKVIKIKRICKVGASISNQLKKHTDQDKVVFLPMENISENGKIDCSIKQPIAKVRTGFSSFAKNDVIVAKITPCFENGKGACLDELESDIGYGTTELFNLRAGNDVLPKYLYYITMTKIFRSLGEGQMTGSAGQKRVPADFIRNFVIGLPSIAIQYKIIDYICLKTSQINRLICTKHKQLEFLKELCSTIISDVVTGKIDVRNIPVPAYEHVDDLTADDGEDNDEETGIPGEED